MGVNIIVVVENSKNISLGAFRQGLLSDTLGEFIWNPPLNKEAPAWDAFEYEGKHYFGWCYPPRYRHIRLYDQDKGGPRKYARVQHTFLKCMLTIERLAGGPIYIGNDHEHLHSLQQAEECESTFALPPEILDDIMPKWRTVEDIEIPEPELVF